VISIDKEVAPERARCLAESFLPGRPEEVIIDQPRAWAARHLSGVAQRRARIWGWVRPRHSGLTTKVP
jgi:hypothetical protein